MDSFDNYYNNLNKLEGTGLRIEQKELFKFGSSKLTMIFVIILWVLLVYPFISSLMTGSIDYSAYVDLSNIPNGIPAGYEPTNMGNGLFSTIIQIVMAFIIPIGFYLIYTGSKTEDKHKVANGFKFNKIYFQISKVILIIVAVLFGLIMLLFLVAAPGISIIALLIFGGMFYVLFKIYNMFIEFFGNMALVALGKYKPVPLALNIKTVFIVLLILNVVGLFIFFVLLMIFTNQAAYFPEIAQYIDIDGLLEALALPVSISIIISLGSSIYYIYYIDKFNKHFHAFNQYVRKLDDVEEELE